VNLSILIETEEFFVNNLSILSESRPMSFAVAGKSASEEKGKKK